ncbi:hypothetical protein [Paeniglutamicibacter cryotolerans]|uniref:Uncharacterized protein n=1 Tax=Paeniglutamicibacter cryotolerans TaxID=670079 RepID=A0A839QUN9_9MICC|nr:hypothetical protein [Paeniglutamicibacter cryotolerans]MBB2997676.1 hypothetical protein [Paeniglutamicibacter cryotolerans]
MFVKPTAEPPHRVMVLMACRESWYEASDDERSTVALPTLQHLLEDWEALGFELLHSFDDDFFLVGQPGSLQFPITILGTVPSLDTIVQMMNRARTTVNGERADRYYRFESRLGRKLFLLPR